MRKLYSVAMYLGLPLVLTHLFLRGLRDPAWLRRWRERFGHPPVPAGAPGGLIVHAASVGEVNAAAPLVRALLERYAERRLTVTTFTPTGSARAHALFGDRVVHAYAPLDLPGAARRFLHGLRPAVLILMETEIWPNLLATAAQRGVPVLLANARLSERSVRGYRRWRRLISGALQDVTHIAAQSRADADRFVACGADASRTGVSGSLKYDVQPPRGVTEQAATFRTRWGIDRPVLLAGSTHEEDERVVLEAFISLRARYPDALLILVPRHPERFGQAAGMARAAGLQTELRSATEACSPTAACFVIDAMGELMRYYACCDVAFVGGSFARVGGHNVLEPAALGKPVLVGPHTFNFEEITESLFRARAALRCGNAGEFERHVDELFRDADRRNAMGEAGRALVQSGRGALDRTLTLLDSLVQH
jgi:3-deoxy-D-manno-octulosonic-acid transferase